MFFYKRNGHTFLTFVLAISFLSTTNIYAQETTDTASDSFSDTAYNSNYEESDNSSAINDMENMLDEERAYFNNLNNGNVSSDNNSNEPSSNESETVNIDNNPPKIKKKLTRKEIKALQPAKQPGVKLEVGFNYIPTWALGISLSVGKQFKNITDHFAIGLYGQNNLSLGRGLCDWPLGFSVDANLLLKFHITMDTFVFTPFIGAGYGYNVIMVYFSSGIFITEGFSFDWFVRHNMYVGFDLIVKEAFINYTPIAGFSAIQFKGIQPQGGFHFGFKFLSRPKKK